MKKLLLILLALPMFAWATPFETSTPSASTCANLDHYNVHVGSAVTAVAPTLNTSGQCYFHYDIGALISGLSTSAANALLATYSVAGANAINQEGPSSPFAPLPAVPGAVGPLTVTAQ